MNNNKVLCGVFEDNPHPGYTKAVLVSGVLVAFDADDIAVGFASYSENASLTPSLGFTNLEVGVWKGSRRAHYLNATRPFYWNNYLLQSGGFWGGKRRYS